MQFRVELVVPPDVAFVPLVQSTVVDACERAELDPARHDDLATAAADGFLAIVEQSMVESSEPIRVILHSEASELRVRIRERGLPLGGVAARRDPAWARIATKVDAMHWHAHGASGSELELIVNHGPPQRESEAQPPINDVPLAPPQEYTIRRFEPADAPAVARAFYLTYGYHYDFPAVYEPRRLIALNATGRYISTAQLAKTARSPAIMRSRANRISRSATAAARSYCPRTAGGICSINCAKAWKKKRSGLDSKRISPNPSPTMAEPSTRAKASARRRPQSRWPVRRAVSWPNTWSSPRPRSGKVRCCTTNY